jgi:acid phosphatase (class A)
MRANTLDWSSAWPAATGRDRFDFGKGRKMYRHVGLGLALALLAAGCSSTSAPSKIEAATAKPKPAAPAGYLAAADLPDSLSLIPPPPAPGSAAQARDDEAAKAAVALSGGPRWLQAVTDANLGFPAAAETFSCAMDVQINQADTPHLYTLLRRTLLDAGRSPYPTKKKYQRARPFTVNGAPLCTPAFEAALRKDGSYPSGHAAIGWGWALVLAEVAPDRADAILARGRAFTQSRVVCNVHWTSDIEEGRVMGAATFAKLQSSAEFRDDLKAAQAEVTAARAKGLRPTGDCAKEAAQLAAG